MALAIVLSVPGMTAGTLCVITPELNASILLGVLCVIFMATATMCANLALKQLSAATKPKKIVHQLYTPYEQYKMDMGIEKGSEKEKMMDRFHAKYCTEYSPMKRTDL